MLTSIPIISPITVQLGDPGPRLLGAPASETGGGPSASEMIASEMSASDAPDYEVHPLGAPLSLDAPTVDPATRALDEMELAAQISEYHDFSWWDERIRIVRAAIARAASG